MPLDPNAVQWDSPATPGVAPLDPNAVQWDDPHSDAVQRTLVGDGNEKGGLSRQLGLAARAVGPEAAGALAGAGAGALIGGVGAVPGAVAGAGAAAITRLIDRTFGTDYLSRVMDEIGIPKPETPTERIVGDVASAMASIPGAVGIGKSLAASARPTVQRIGIDLQSHLGAQTASTIAGAGASGMVREEGGGPIAQSVAGLAGSMLPFAPQLAAGGVRRVIRGPDSNIPKIEKNIADFRDSGDSATAAQATGTHAAQSIENALARTPGSAGPMMTKMSTQASNIGKKVDEIASSASLISGPVPAGRALDKALGKDGSFIENFRTTARGLYNQIDKYVPPSTPIDVSSTRQILARLTSPAPGAEETSKILMNARVLKIQEALAGDMAGNPGKQMSIAMPDGSLHTFSVGGTPSKSTLPYEALKELRTRVGDMLSGNELISDIPKGQLKQLYGAITADIGRGIPAAGRSSWSRANTFYKAGLDRIDLLQSVANKADPETMFNYATSGAKDGGTKIKAIMQSLPEDARNILTATVTRRLGHAKPGVQNEYNDVFSTESFLTNWNHLSPEAKQALFGRQNDGYREALDRVASVAARIREGSKIFSNPAGTAAALTNQAATVGTAASAATLLATGHPILATGLVGGAVGVAKGAGATAELLMTNPAFVKWLARASTQPTSTVPAQLNALARIAASEKDNDRREALKQYIIHTPHGE